MASNVFSLGRLVWQLLNLLALIAGFVFLSWCAAKALRQRKSATAKADQSGRPLCVVIREHRNCCKVTQEFVAESLGVSRQAVSKWERAPQICLPWQALRCAAEALLKGLKR